MSTYHYQLIFQFLVGPFYFSNYIISFQVICVEFALHIQVDFYRNIMLCHTLEHHIIFVGHNNIEEVLRGIAGISATSLDKDGTFCIAGGGGKDCDRSFCFGKIPDAVCHLQQAALTAEITTSATCICI